MAKRSNKKAQAAMEFLMTYGWAILVVIIAIGALVYVGIKNPERFITNQCTLSPPLSCSQQGDYVAYSRPYVSNPQQISESTANVLLKVTNGVGRYIEEVSAILITANNITCVSSSANPKSIEGSKKGKFFFSCPNINSESLSSKWNGAFTINYKVSSDGYSTSSIGKIVTEVQQPIINIFTYQCNDSIDNDNDNKTDYPGDPDCSSASDNDEFNTTQQNVIMYQCDDNIDNDNDGSIDYLNDVGCNSFVDNTETSSSLVCDNNLDETDDADPLADYRLSGGDPGCTGPIDTSEIDARCDDKSDNDADELIDYPNDPGCDSYSDNDEYNTPIATQCSDSIDNDGDSLIDYPNDPGCTGQTDNAEYDTIGACTNWTRTYQNIRGIAQDVAVDNEGNIYITGKTMPTPTYAFLLKYDKCGNLLWDIIFNEQGKDYEEGYGVVVDNKGSVYVVGYFTKVYNYDTDIWVAKYNTNTGENIWTKLYDYKSSVPQEGVWEKLEDYGMDIVLDKTTNYLYISGSHTSQIDPTPGDPADLVYTEGIILVKLETVDGDLVWFKLFGTNIQSEYSTAKGITIGNSNDLYVLAPYKIRKFDTEGKFIWAVDTKTQGKISFDPIANSVYTISHNWYYKHSSDGTLLNSFNILKYSIGSEVYAKGDIITYTGSANTYEAILVGQRNAATNQTLWENIIGSPNYGNSGGMAITSDIMGNYYAAGYLHKKDSKTPLPFDQNIWIRKYPPTGISGTEPGPISSTFTNCAGPGLTVPTYGSTCCEGLVLQGNVCNFPR